MKFHWKMTICEISAISEEITFLRNLEETEQREKEFVEM